jgi:hypothetical protein
VVVAAGVGALLVLMECVLVEVEVSLVAAEEVVLMAVVMGLVLDHGELLHLMLRCSEVLASCALTTTQG